jgi:hypothetical protein
LGKAKAQEGRANTTVLIYVDTGKEVGDVDHLQSLRQRGRREQMFDENDPEGVAFEYPVVE